MILEWKCKLHIDTFYDHKAKVIPFTEATLENCRKKQELRLKVQKRSKYSTIVLPSYADGLSGYHSRCHKYFCSFPSGNQNTTEPTLTQVGQIAIDESSNGKIF